jgi:dimethylargininase
MCEGVEGSEESRPTDETSWLIALTREVSPNFGQCELTHLPRQQIDVALARAQHRFYEECLTSLGCQVHRLPATPELPDGVFVEDVCLVLDELAVITRPGAASRQAETASVAEQIRHYRPLRFIEAPATVDGGDVLCLGKRVFVGQSSRTNDEGIDQLRTILAPHGYSVTGVSLLGGLHLKSAVTDVGKGILLVNRSWIDPAIFCARAIVEVAPSEPFGANALLVNGTVVYPTAFPDTQRRLQDSDIQLRIVDLSEIGKAEGGVTCCSLIFSAR